MGPVVPSWDTHDVLFFQIQVDLSHVDPKRLVLQFSENVGTNYDLTFRCAEDRGNFMVELRNVMMLGGEMEADHGIGVSGRCEGRDAPDDAGGGGGGAGGGFRGGEGDMANNDEPLACRRLEMLLKDQQQLQETVLWQQDVIGKMARRLAEPGDRGGGGGGGGGGRTKKSLGGKVTLSLGTSSGILGETDKALADNGWKRRLDATTGHEYFTNMETGETRWTYPLSLPEL